MRPWHLILLIVILGFFAVTTGWNILYILTYVVLCLVILSWLWTFVCLQELVFHRNTIGGGYLQVGDVFEERLVLDNLSTLPKLWVQITDGSTLPGHQAGYIASMGGRKRAIWRARSRCRLRGRFQLGPVIAMSGDPFGLFNHHLSLSSASEILVLPRVHQITQLAIFAGGLPGRGKSAQHALQKTTNATSVREYVIGDSLSRIHWRSSARYNKLMVKEFDLDPAIDAWIFLDLHAAVQAGEGEHSTEEYGVTIAATIAHYLLRQDLSVGLVVNGERQESLALDRGDRQFQHMLEMLAVVSAGSGPKLKDALARDPLHFGRNSIAIVITPSNTRDWHESLRHLQLRGVQVAVVGLIAASFEPQPTNEDTLILLEEMNIPVVRVRYGEAIPAILQGL
jgi:uncharacterized protein (DUF58 family)